MSKRRKRKKPKSPAVTVDLSSLMAEPPTGSPPGHYETIPLPGGRLLYGDVIDLKGKQVYRQAADLNRHPLGEEGRN